MKIRVSRAALAVAMLVVGGITLPQPAVAQTFSYDGSVRYAQGRYTLDRSVASTIWLNELSYSASEWWAELAIPVIYQGSADVRYVGGMPVPGHGPHTGSGAHPHGGGGGGGMPGGHHPPPDDPSATETFDRLGIPDAYLRLGGVAYRDAFDRNSIGGFVALKAPLSGGSAGFGTGEWDFGGGLTWSRRAQKRWLHAELSYWALGEPADLSLRNPFGLELVYGRAVGDSPFSLEVAAWGRTEIVDGVASQAAVDLTVTRRLRSRGGLYLTCELGLTESAPDSALVVGYRIAFRP